MVVCRMTLMVCKKKRSKIEIEKKTKWWKLKKEECCEEFRQKLRQALGGQVVLPDDWETTAEVIRKTGRKVLDGSSGRRKEDKETWWWNEEVQDSIQRKRLAKKKWDMERTEKNRQEYKESQRRVKREVSKAKQKAYDELYTRLDTREGEKDLYRIARQGDRDGKDVQQVRVIKDRDGRVLTSEEDSGEMTLGSVVRAGGGNLERWRFVLERRGMKVSRMVQKVTQCQETNTFLKPFLTSFCSVAGCINMLKEVIDIKEYRCHEGRIKSRFSPVDDTGVLYIPNVEDVIRISDMAACHITPSRALDWASVVWDADPYIWSSFAYFAALIDFGATINLIDSVLVEELEISTIPCIPSLRITAIDSQLIGEGYLTRQTELFDFRMGLFHCERLAFYVTSSRANPVILGFPWLRQHDPQISWHKEKLIRWSAAYVSKCLHDPVSCPCFTLSIENLEPLGTRTHPALLQGP
ncbi:hypothetical protein QTP70_002171 [Hemibagrus guttatus]|uniref:Uncharacterized protein n=1 Tax=Hemibagrus guttatus TaxID=175788 RepID=A0AAE0V2T1_9TELE|nr:hypothetical protein QTP70_002171 [Hemibagrus guttatus]